MEIHADSPPATMYPCTECEAEFESEEQLESHIFVHFLALTTEYGCSSCLKLFNKPDELQKHLMDIHAHHLYRCALCKEVFDSKVNVQVHFAIKHSNECKLYKCTTCGSVFRSEMEWQLHVKVNHLGISKPYRCLFCKESFSAEVDLQRHITTHKKQFSCTQCDEAFHVEYLLDKHVETSHFTESEDNKIESQMTSYSKVDYNAGIEIPIRPHTTSPRNATPPKPTPPKPTLSPDNARNITSRNCYESEATVSEPEQSRKELFNKHDTRSRNAERSEHRRLYNCDECDLSFTDEVSVFKHRIRDHTLVTHMNTLKSHNQHSVRTISPQHSIQTSSSLSIEKYNQTCVYCSQSFKTKNELEKHMKTHASPTNQKCNICDDIFPSASVLAEHKLTHCKVTKGNVCMVCKVVIKNDEQFYAHTQQHGFQGTNMQCIICRQTLVSMIEIQMHAEHHFKSTLYSCCMCMKSFDSKENLISKINSNGKTYSVCKLCYHGELSSLKSKSPILTPEKSKASICPVCGLLCDTESQLNSHMAQHNKKSYQCIKCQHAFNTEYEIQVHVATHMLQEGNNHQCYICNHSFDSPAKLQCHLIEHTFDDEKLPYRCYICAALFSSASSIQMHVLEHGVSARQYACPQCPQKFFFAGELQNHILSHGVPPHSLQTPPKSLTCNDCGKIFWDLNSLKVHQRTHNTYIKEGFSPTPFSTDLSYASGSVSCTVCPASFDSMSDMQKHFAANHMSDKDLPRQTFCCLECGKEYSNLRGLHSHMKIHKRGKYHQSLNTINH